MPFSQWMNTAQGTEARGGTDTPSHVVQLLWTSVLAHRDVGWRARVRHHPSHACLMQVHGCVKAVTPASPMAVCSYRAAMAYGLSGRGGVRLNATVSSHVGKHGMHDMDMIISLLRFFMTIGVMQLWPSTRMIFFTPPWPELTITPPEALAARGCGLGL